MNCREFQHEIFEYVEGSLSPRLQAAADAHLAGCVACRELVSRQRQFAQSMSQQLQGATASLRLPPEVGRRVVARVREQTPPPAEPSGWAWLRQRLELPLAIGTCALVLLGGIWLVSRGRPPQTGTAPKENALGPISVQFSYVLPTYTFRRENGHVIDALTYETTVVNETRQVELARRVQ
jgi:predicted anti-sigma-YlaC factor YlaD